MILNRTHKYKKGFFNNQNNHTPKTIMALALSISIFTGTLTNLVLNINNFSVEHVVDINDYYIKRAVVEELYYDDYFSYDDGLVHENPAGIYNHQITTEDLEQIKQLSIAPDKTDILKFCKGLETLEIRGCNFITENTIMISHINSLENLKEITFCFENMDFFLENPTYKIDLDQFQKDIKINFYLDKENDQLLLCSALKQSQLTKEKIKNNRLFFITKAGQISLKEYNDINNQLNEMVNSFAFTPETTDTEKVATLLKTTVELIEYDPYIKDNTYAIMFADKQYAESDEDYDKAMHLTSFYNKYPISSILNENTGYGVCINYTSIFTLLAYKCDMEVYNVHLSNIPHVINLIKMDDVYRFVDITKMDSVLVCPELINQYLGTKDQTQLLNAIKWSTGSGWYDTFEDTPKEYAEKASNTEQAKSSIIPTINEITTHPRIKYTGTSFLKTLPPSFIISYFVSKYLEKNLEREIVLNTYPTKKYPKTRTLKKGHDKLIVYPTTLSEEQESLSQTQIDGKTEDFAIISLKNTLKNFFSKRNKILKTNKCAWSPNLIDATLQDYKIFEFKCDHLKEHLDETFEFIQKNKPDLSNKTIIVECPSEYNFNKLEEQFRKISDMGDVYYKKPNNDQLIPMSINSKQSNQLGNKQLCKKI